MHYELRDEFDVSAGLDDVWKFFSKVANLPKITPAWMNFEIHTPESVVIHQDTVFDYTIRWLGIPFHWKSRILDWDPPRRFVDIQVRGPYSLWHHEHRFTPLESGGVRCFDRVIYQLPLGPIGRLTHSMVVRKQLIEIFRHRRRVIGENLGGVRAVQSDVRIQSLIKAT